MQSVIIDQHAVKVLSQIMDLPGIRGFKIIPDSENNGLNICFFYRWNRQERLENYYIPIIDDPEVFISSIISTLIDALNDLSPKP